MVTAALKYLNINNMGIKVLQQRLKPNFTYSLKSPLVRNLNKARK